MQPSTRHVDIGARPRPRAIEPRPAICGIPLDLFLDLPPSGEDVLDEVIESIAGIVENCFSSGVATAEAIVSADAPGSVALTEIVGKSTLGSAATGSER